MMLARNIRCLKKYGSNSKCFVLLSLRFRNFSLSRTTFNSKNALETELPDKDNLLRKFIFKKKTHTVQEITSQLDELIGKEVTLNGWISRKPRKVSKKLIFGELRDGNGDITQLLASEDSSKKCLEFLKTAFLEDAISVTGTIAIRREAKNQVKQQDTDCKWDLILKEYNILNKSNDLPSKLLETIKKNSDFPANLRYLQLRSKYYQDALKLRSKTASIVRKTLNLLNFIEIETPLLFKSTPEGAREFLVPTRKPRQFYALPQSPQQYKQLLMASGVNKYYQIAKCFRDEDLRKDRQPEFTQVDMELAFSNAEDVMLNVEQVVKNVWQDVRNLNFFKLNKDGDLIKVNHLDANDNFTKIPYLKALENFGIDKPDLRSGLTFKPLTFEEYGVKVIGEKAEEFPIFEICILRNAFNNTKETQTSLFDAQNYKSRIPISVSIESDQDCLNWYKNFEKIVKFESNTKLQKLILELNLQKGDIIAGSTRSKLPYENPTPLGRFRQLSIEAYPTKWRRKLLNFENKDITESVKPKDVFVASWIVDFPLFSPLEISETDSNGYPVYNYYNLTSTHHPFTMCNPKDYDLLSTNPLKVHGEHYDLVINGVELGGGSRRIHDTSLQKYIFNNILKIGNYQQLFGHLLNAFDIGCPPHAGLAIGFDRMCAMLLNSESIRDVVAFPKTKTGADAVVNSPSDVSDITLQEYHIKKLE
ncbi:hypothetical protein PACTADRAFT_63000 [Pachysolen tannophilus NRRL Y-2460]|uniref:Aminoacyl-transfer RNA synthetases class-II family profile domain-containing protein n=1 Tax=Pachysolen tannophilus NRRL Y-2460 TaxID=669874 RepID=A0A1E4U0S3_PACTA|nr:hypothetical protein PACTADRAFT_63000 [Pachysolen tannophilus NRRL Y-2460]